MKGIVSAMSLYEESRSTLGEYSLLCPMLFAHDKETENSHLWIGDAACHGMGLLLLVSSRGAYRDMDNCMATL